MRDYEVVYIFDSSLGRDDVEARLERFHGVATQPQGAEVTAVDHWGVRQLAYPVRRQRTGYYVVAQLRTEPSALPEFERRIKLDEDVMRHLVVLNEGEPTSGRSILAQREAESVDTEEGDAPAAAEGDAPAATEGDVGAEDEEELEEMDSEEEAEGVGAASPPEFSGGRGQRRRVEGPVIEVLNYKDVDTLSRFITEQGKILPRRTTKVSAQFQRNLGRAVKRARHLALMPYVPDHEA